MPSQYSPQPPRGRINGLTVSTGMPLYYGHTRYRYGSEDEVVLRRLRMVAGPALRTDTAHAAFDPGMPLAMALVVSLGLLALFRGVPAHGEGPESDAGMRWERVDTDTRWAEIAKVNALLDDPCYVDYQRWFGSGRHMKQG
jgi:hypothetical protein